MAAPPRASQPLLTLECVAFDSETTGLDVRKARLIELGAIRIRDAVLVEDDRFERLVDPGEPIPPESRAIHHIDDGMVAGAPAFPEVAAAFRDWCGDAPLIGFASGFDLAMLKREYQLAGLRWEAPACLDVRFLAQLAAPQLPDFSLDTIAAWLGIGFSERHRALGDARATAEVFVALLPRLRERGLRTLGEAQRAAERVAAAAAGGELRLGWEDIHGARGSDRRLAVRFDSHPFRHRVRELMHAPPQTVAPETPLAEVLSLLLERRISSVFVTRGEDTGILTERDLLRELSRDPAALASRVAADAANFPLHCIDQDSYAFRANATMRHAGYRHLGVRDGAGRLVGALSARDLLRPGNEASLFIGEHIEGAGDAAALARAWGDIALVARQLYAERVEAREIAAVISESLRALSARACAIAEAAMATPAPSDYALLVLGSGGRGESLLAMDQDNAIVYRDGAAVRDWFLELGRACSTLLDAAGVPFCPGNIMASNPDWCQPLDAWRATVGRWISRRKPEDILNCDIFFDARPVHGEVTLAGELMTSAYAAGAEAGEFLKLMSINACKPKSPLGLFNRFKLEDGRADLKMGGILPLFSCARILAIRHRLSERGTADRLRAYAALEPERATTVTNLVDAHGIILDCILQQQLADLADGVPLSNRVAPATLHAAARDQLTWALQQVPNISNLLGDPLSAG